MPLAQGHPVWTAELDTEFWHSDVQPVAFSTVLSWGSWGITEEVGLQGARRAALDCCSAALLKVPGHVSQPGFFQQQVPGVQTHRTQCLPHRVEIFQACFCFPDISLSPGELTPFHPVVGCSLIGPPNCGTGSYRQGLDTYGASSPMDMQPNGYSQSVLL